MPDQPTEIQILDDIEILDPDSEVEEIIEYEVSAADFKAYSSQQLYYADTSANSINKKRKIS